MAADPLPVLMVLADQRDFFAQESGDAGLAVEQPAMTAEPTNDYSAIVFVGGWGSSMYQYSFEGTYSHSASRPTPAADDVVVDGRIITAENGDAAHTLDTAAVDRVLAAVAGELTDPELASVARSPLTATKPSPATPLLHAVLVDNE